MGIKCTCAAKLFYRKDFYTTNNNYSYYYYIHYNNATFLHSTGRHYAHVFG